MVVRMGPMTTRSVIAAMVLAILAVWPASAAPARWQPRADATWQIQRAMRKHLDLDAWRSLLSGRDDR
jgi:hypothetical protein